MLTFHSNCLKRRQFKGWNFNQTVSIGDNKKIKLLSNRFWTIRDDHLNTKISTAKKRQTMKFHYNCLSQRRYRYDGFYSDCLNRRWFKWNFTLRLYEKIRKNILKTSDWETEVGPDSGCQSHNKYDQQDTRPVLSKYGLIRGFSPLLYSDLLSIYQPGSHTNWLVPGNRFCWSTTWF